MLASTESRHFREPLAPKVPEITVLFWLIKVLTTGMGESTSDYLAGLNRVLAGAAVMVGFAIAMWLQFRTRRYVAVVYWFAVAMVAVAGTVAADILHIGFGIPYLDSTIFYALVVAVIFWLWYRSQGTLSIHSILTRTREIYYWLTVLATFALGTAAGDLTAASMHLGYRTSAVLFAALIAVPAVGWWKFRLNPVVAFWFAYIITRPLGASIADWLGKRRSLSGIGWGDGPVAGVAAIVIAILVGYLAIACTDIQPGINQGVRSAGRTGPRVTG
ncbi:MAG: hypothetical protein M3Y77_03280 [Actinomycetota bacterium]|nr:hypothetical protein [Actinomycetota bacterium]